MSERAAYTLTFSSSTTRPTAGRLEHAVLVRGVVLELAHRQLAAHAPGVEDEGVGIEHGIFIGQPFAPGQHAVDLLQIAVEGLQAGVLDARIGRGVGSVALGPADMGVRRMHAGGKEADRRQRLGLAERVLRPQVEALAEIGQDRRVLRQRIAVVEAQHRHAALRIDFQIGVRALLAAGEVDFLRFVFFAALFEHDVRRHRAGARRVIKHQHCGILLKFMSQTLRSSSSIDTPSGARMKQTRTPGRTVVGSRVNSTPLALRSAAMASMPRTESPK